MLITSFFQDIVIENKVGNLMYQFIQVLDYPLMIDNILLAILFANYISNVTFKKKNLDN